MASPMNKWVGLGAAGIVVLGLFLSLRSCGLYDENSELRGRILEMTKIATADHTMLTNEIGQLTKDIGQKDKEIAKLKEERIIINTAMSGKDKELAALRTTWAKFSVECQAALVALDTKWQEKALLYEGNSKIEQATTAAWIGKYNDAIKIGDNWKRDRDNEYTISQLKDKRIKGLESSLRWSRFWKTSTSILAVVGGAYVAYDLIRGK